MTTDTARPQPVQVALTARGYPRDNEPVNLKVVLHYDPADPCAVRLMFPFDDGTDIIWGFGRDLLADGLNAPAGLHDVQVWPVRSSRGDQVAVRLSSPEGEALLKMTHGMVSRFVADMYAAVPRGTEMEHLNLDVAITALLDGAR